MNGGIMKIIDSMGDESVEAIRAIKWGFKPSELFEWVYCTKT